MSQQTVRSSFVIVLIALLLMLVVAQPLAAKDNRGNVEVKGTVTSINTAAGSFQVLGQDGKTYTIIPNAGFDLSKLQVGDMVEVKGTLNANGSISAIKIDQEDEGGHGPSAGYFCTQSDVPHPVGARLAKQYEMKYADLQAWFCDGFGWGQIKLALQTAKATGADAAGLLKARRSGEGWGQIWQELKLIGRARADVTPATHGSSAQTGGAGKSDAMKAKGKPAATDQSGVSKANGKPAVTDQSKAGKGNGKPEAATQSNKGKGRK